MMCIYNQSRIHVKPLLNIIYYMTMLPDHMLIETSTPVSEQNAPIDNTLQGIIHQTD